MIVVCDRCRKELDVKDRAPSSRFTCGYYVVSDGSSWSAFADSGESNICDCCMWCDARYIAVYGKVPHEVI